ncbi:MAG: hypothetical protein ACLQJR_24200 [Stellaceae bacterium]
MPDGLTADDPPRRGIFLFQTISSPLGEKYRYHFGLDFAGIFYSKSADFVNNF